jgi:hypothetical protein
MSPRALSTAARAAAMVVLSGALACSYDSPQPPTGPGETTPPAGTGTGTGTGNGTGTGTNTGTGTGTGSGAGPASR